MSSVFYPMIAAPDSPHHTAAWFDYQLGRRPSHAPAHLSRILYIPRHDDHTLNLSIYEVGEQYRNAVEDSLLGSTIYTNKLGLMVTPKGDCLNDQVAYLVEMRRPGAGLLHVRATATLHIHLQKRELQHGFPDVELTMSPISPTITNDNPTTVVSSGDNLMKMYRSFPIPDTTRGSKIIKHPYLVLKAVQEKVAATGESLPLFSDLEWRLDPKDGILRYSLVQEGRDPAIGSSIYAIYHHFGWGLSLSLPYSEGVLLLPEPSSSSSPSLPGEELEGIVVASLLALLAQLRTLSASKEDIHRPGCIARMVRRATNRLGNGHGHD